MNNSKTEDPFPCGQLLMVGIPGPGMDAVARELVRDLKVGGIILFARNLESPEQVWQLTQDLQREARAGRRARPCSSRWTRKGAGCSA